MHHEEEILIRLQRTRLGEYAREEDALNQQLQTKTRDISELVTQRGVLQQQVQNQEGAITHTQNLLVERTEQLQHSTQMVQFLEGELAQADNENHQLLQQVQHLQQLQAQDAEEEEEEDPEEIEGGSDVDSQ